MKKVILAIIILLVILTAGILENVYVNKLFNSLDDRLEEASACISDEDPTSLDKVRKLSAWWEKKRGFLELFSYSPDLRAFSVALGETEGSLAEGDFLNAASKIRSLLTMSSNIRRVLDFNVEDII